MKVKDTKLTFKRYEKKYLLTAAQYERIRARLDAYIEPDEFFSSTVCSLYYDTGDFELIRRSIDAPVYKEKLRVRAYNVPAPDGTVFVELKKKFKGVVYKRRVMMAADTAMRYLAGDDEELRITFDRSIRWRGTELDLTLGDHGEELLDAGQVLMEIKIPEAAPLWLAHMLSEDGLFPQGFSKYGTCYKTNLIKGVILNV